MTGPPSDDDLVAAANAGDAGAFEQIYRRYRDFVHRLALRLTGDEDLALDVLQETFLYLLGRFPGFRLTARFSTFLYAVVRHRALAARRRAGRQVADASALDSAPAPRERDRDANAARAELADMLAALPEAQREVLLLRYAEGLSLAEIAQAIEIPLGTVKSRLHNALKALREDPRTRNYFEK